MGRMKLNKKLGYLFLILALWLIFPIPGPDDAISYYAFTLFSGVPYDLDNLSSVYLDYVIFTTVLGIIFLLISMQLLGWSFKRLFKKLDIGKYKISLGVGIGALILITYLNLLNLIYYILGILALIYYFQIRKDFSEGLAVFISPLILLWFGFSNLIGFIFQRMPIPDSICGTKAPVIWISSTLGFSGVTPLSLIISVLIGVILIFLLTKVLKDKF